MNKSIEIGKAIRRRRRELDMSQLQLAQRAGVSEGSVRRWEKGENLTVDSAELVLKALGLKLAVTERGGLRI